VEPGGKILAGPNILCLGKDFGIPRTGCWHDYSGTCWTFCVDTHLSLIIPLPLLLLPQMAILPLPSLWHGHFYQKYNGKSCWGSYLNVVSDHGADYATIPEWRYHSLRSVSTL
jgi:hypothetical protein